MGEVNLTEDGTGAHHIGFGRLDYGTTTGDFAPILWPVNYGGRIPPVFADGSIDQSSFEAMATDMLWNWTKRIFGTRQAVVRPVRIEDPLWEPSSFTGAGPWPINPGFGSGHSTIAFPIASGWMPVIVNGEWFNVRCGTCGQVECSCLPDKRVSVRLPGPVAAVEEVLIDGQVLDPSAYRLAYGSMLIRQDGQPWPNRNNLNIDPTVVPDSGAPYWQTTWAVTYRKGIPVPAGGQIAAGTLAEQLALAAIGSSDCQLPQRIATISREGLSVELAQPYRRTTATNKSALDDPPASPTGIWSIDSWVDGMNIPRPHASVHSVDRPGSDKWRY